MAKEKDQHGGFRNPESDPLAAPAGARDYAADVLLKDGGTIHIRAIRPEDKKRLQELFHSLSDQSVYYRFFTRKRELSPSELDYLTGVDQVRHVALAAVIPPGSAAEPMIGVARYAIQGKDHAEVAYAVADAHQRRGIGSVLLQHLAAVARAAGLTTFVANVLLENVPLQRAFLARSGFQPTVTVKHGVARLSFPVGPAKHG